MQRKMSHYSLVAVVMMMTVAGCQDDEFTVKSASSNEIRFGVTMQDNVTANAGSRSGSVPAISLDIVPMCDEATGDSLYMHPCVSDFPDGAICTQGMSRSGAVSLSSMYDSFGVSAYYYTGSWDSSLSQSEPNFFVSDNAVLSGSVYTLSPSRYWPQNGNMRFLAYAPVDDSNYQYFSWIDDASNPRGSYIHIDVPQNAADQKDLLVAYTAQINSKTDHAPASLNFKHAMAGINFELKSDMQGYRLKKVTISNVISKGDFIYNLDDASEESSAATDISSKCTLWALTEGYSTYLEYDENTDSDSQMFFMLPQWVAEAPVEVVLETTDASKSEFVIDGYIRNSSWIMGKIVTYRISVSDSGLEVTEPSTFDYRGMIYNADAGTFSSLNQVAVTSYIRSNPDTWTVTYQEPGKAASTSCDWLTYTVADDSENPNRKLVGFKAASTAVDIDVDQRLASATSKGSASAPYNLASSTGKAGVVENSANCYIVDSKGYYSIPLVYGNSISNGSDIKTYVYSGSMDNSLSNFKNHLGQNIASAWIADAANTGCTPRGATLVWQDEPNLVTNVNLNTSAYSGHGGLTFEVGSGIKQGNAVIAVTDGTDIIWSWHIWITNLGLDSADESVAVTNHDGKTYDAMPVNLGWCSSDADGDGKVDPVKYYKRRTCDVTFTSSKGLTQTITIVQESHVAVPRGNNVYYQWGRKDPFVGTNVNWGNKTWYDQAGTHTDSPSRIYSDSDGSARKTTKDAIAAGDLIKNPGKWHNPPGEELHTTTPTSTNEIYNNLWEGQAVAAGGYAKTVYDPSPAGWKVPYNDAFTGFTTNGQNTPDSGADMSIVNYVLRSTLPSGDSGAEVMEFYTSTDKLHSIIFPQTGYRDWNSNAGIYHFGDEKSGGLGQGFVWLSGIYELQNAYNFKFAYEVLVQPRSAFYACDGFPVRAVRE